MAHSHLKIIAVVEDIEGEGANLRPRVRVQFIEYKPRSGFINLKNASAEQIKQFQKLVGGDAMVPIREGMMNGQTFYQFLQSEDIITIHEPEKIQTAKTVELVGSEKNDAKPLFGAKTA